MPQISLAPNFQKTATGLIDMFRDSANQRLHQEILEATGLPFETSARDLSEELHSKRLSISLYLSRYWLMRVGSKRSRMMELAVKRVNDKCPNWPADFTEDNAEAVRQEFCVQCIALWYKKNPEHLGVELKQLLAQLAGQECSLYEQAIQPNAGASFDKIAGFSTISADRANRWVYEMRIISRLSGGQVELDRVMIRPIHIAWIELFAPELEASTLGEFEQSQRFIELARGEKIDPFDLAQSLLELSQNLVRNPKFLVRKLTQLELID